MMCCLVVVLIDILSPIDTIAMIVGYESLKFMNTWPMN